MALRRHFPSPRFLYIVDVQLDRQDFTWEIIHKVGVHRLLQQFFISGFAMKQLLINLRFLVC